MTETVDIMTNHDLLDNVFGQLQGSAHETVELALANDPLLAARSARLRLAIDSLLDDGFDLEPPAGLADRTSLAVGALARREQIVKKRKRFSDYLPSSVPFRTADLAVAATIFVAGILTMVPAIQRSRDRMSQAGCTFNLQQLGLGLLQYRDRYNSYPYIPPESPASHAGSFALMLHDAGYLDDPRRLHCPCYRHSGNTEHPPLLDFAAACQLKEENPKRFQEVINGDYAYQADQRSAGSPRMNVSLQIAPTAALLADQPPHDGQRTILEGNSPNHRSMGQNVLFGDGHSQWYRSRRLNPHDADMFQKQNQQERTAPGDDFLDSALVPSPFPFHGYK